jgi:hypothetical protein
MYAAAKIPQEPTLELEKDPQHLRNNEDDLAMGDIQEKLLPYPLSSFLEPLGVSGGTEAVGATGEHQEPLLTAVRTADAGKPAARVAAVQIALDHLPDDRPEERF